MSCRSVSRLLTNNIVSHSSNYKISRNISKSSWMQARIVEVVPALGESITEGSIASWNKNVGDHVAIDDVIVIVETDKVTVDIKSTNAGVLVAKLADDTVRKRSADIVQLSIVLRCPHYICTGPYSHINPS